MLTNTFRHIPGIGLKTEKKFWQAGINCWDDFKEPLPLKFTLEKTALVEQYLAESKKNLADNPLFFAELLQSSQHWRLFPHFQQSTVYLDIETTGLDDRGNEITTIAMYDGQSVNCYINGRNLNDFVADLQCYDVVVTYNGRAFDLPFIERYFDVAIDKAHIDLRYVLRALGYSGGLKKCEQQLGLDRGGLSGVDGFFAVLLWREYQQNGDPRVLETLLAYNIEDVVNLEPLMVSAYNLCLESTPFSKSNKLDYPCRPFVPFKVDEAVLSRIRQRYCSYAPIF